MKLPLPAQRFFAQSATAHPTLLTAHRPPQRRLKGPPEVAPQLIHRHMAARPTRASAAAAVGADQPGSPPPSGLNAPQSPDDVQGPGPSPDAQQAAPPTPISAALRKLRSGGSGGRVNPAKRARTDAAWNLGGGGRARAEYRAMVAPKESPAAAPPPPAPAVAAAKNPAYTQ